MSTGGRGTFYTQTYFTMFKKAFAFAIPGMASAFLLLSSVSARAATIDVGSSTAAMDEGKDATVALIAKLGLLGIGIVLALIAGAVGVIFIRMGFKKGMKALHGKV